MRTAGSWPRWINSSDRVRGICSSSARSGTVSQPFSLVAGIFASMQPPLVFGCDYTDARVLAPVCRFLQMVFLDDLESKGWETTVPLVDRAQGTSRAGYKLR